MKTRLLLLFILSGYISLAQWSQVGSAQFTNSSTNSAISFHPVTGEIYVIHNDASDGNKSYVKKFDGTNWVAVGSAVSNESSANHAINFNPITNEPWIAYRRTSDNQMDVYSFNGSNWVSRGTNINYNFVNSRLQIQFNSSGDVRVAGKINNQKLRVIQFPGGVLSNTAIEDNIIFTNSGSVQNYDFVSYNNYFLSYTNTGNSYAIGRRNVGVTSIGSFNWYVGGSGRRIYRVSGVENKNLGASYRENGNTKEILVFYNNTATPISFYNTTKDIVELRAGLSPTKNYLMYSDSGENLSFSLVNNNGTINSTLPSPGLSTSDSGFFVDMEINPVNGNMYISYMDNGKTSVKEYTIAQPLNKYYVNKNVVGGNGSGDSWANAMTELSDALDASGSTTTEIWVASGTYIPGTSTSDSFNLTIDDLKIYGGFDGTENLISDRNVLANPTILSGDINGDDGNIFGFFRSNTDRIDNSYNIVKVNANNVIIDGFQINNGMANGSGTLNYGSAIQYSDTSENPVIRNCQFKNNVGSTGGAIRVYFNVNTTMTIENSYFYNNLSRYGSGLYLLVNSNRIVSANITNCLFENNTSKDVNASTVGFTGSSIWARANTTGSNLTTTITNCTFANNIDIGTQSGSQRGTLALSDRTDGNSTHNATINNCIIYGNAGSGGNSTLDVNRGHTSFPNSVLVNNSIGENGFSNISSGNLTNTSNSDPLFTDAGNGDFTLQSISPGVDFGDNSLIPSGVSKDLVGNDRILNGTVDMGAYELDFNGPARYFLTVTTPNNGSVTTTPNPNSITGTYNDGTIVTLTAIPDAGYQFAGWSGDVSGTNPSTSIVMDANKTVTASFIELPIYVDINATGNNDGTSWTDAYTDLQTAMNAGANSKEVWVAKGVYKPTGTGRNATFNVKLLGKVYGGFAGTEVSVDQRDMSLIHTTNATILSGDLNGDDNSNLLPTESTRQDNAYHVVTVKNLGGGNLGFLDGFIIQDGNANGSLSASCSTYKPNQYDHRTGGAIYAHTGDANEQVWLSLKNSIVRNNTATNSAVFSRFNPCGATGTKVYMDFISCIIKNNYSLASANLNYGGSQQYNIRAYGDIVNSLIVENSTGASNESSALIVKSSGSSGTTPAATVSVINTTIANNISPNNKAVTVDLISASSYPVYFNNTIVYNNGGTSSMAVSGYGSSANYADSMIDSYNTNNPMLGSDYRLLAGSPAIDAGNNSRLPSGITKDLSGKDRVENGTVDLGPYEGLELRINLSAKVFLQGTMLNNGGGNLMRDDLRVAGLIPIASPYTDGATCNASVFNVTGNDAIVDWVWVELRDKNDNTSALSSSSALLQRDGDVVGVNGTSALSFIATADDYYVTIKHRNHLGIMTSSAITLSNTVAVVNFTDANNQITYGTNAQTSFGIQNGVVAMWSGDSSGEGQLNYLGSQSDVPNIRSQVFNDPNNSVFGGPPVATYGSLGYYRTDINMDGVSYYAGGTSDVLIIRNNIFNNPSNSVFGGPPVGTFLFTQQLPEGINN